MNTMGTTNGTRSEPCGERTTETEAIAEADIRTTSSRSMALEVGHAELDEDLAGLTRALTSRRPDWRRIDILNALAADDRPYAVVFDAAAVAAADPDTRHPGRIRYINAVRTGATPTPPTPAQLNDPRLRCNNGAMIQATGYCCALCRNGVTP